MFLAFPRLHEPKNTIFLIQDDEKLWSAWAEAKFSEAVRLGLDGFNLDFEDPVEQGSQRSKALQGLVYKYEEQNVQ